MEGNVNFLYDYLMSNREKSIILLANLSLLFFSYSIFQIKWVIVDAIDFLGLASHLPLIYWIGLGIIVLCISMVCLSESSQSRYLLLYLLFILGIYLFGLGIFSHDVVRNYTSYYPAGEVNTVLTLNHINISSPYPLISYRSWPAIHIISASILFITDLNFIDFIRYMPLFWLICFILITFSIGSTYLSLNYRFILSALSLSAFWSSQDYYSPQSISLILYILIFLLMVNLAVRKNTAKDRVQILLFLSLTITHMLTSITAIISVLVSSFYKRENRFLILLVLFISWYIYLSPTVLEWGIVDFIRKTSELDIFSAASSKLKYNSFIELRIKYIQSIYIIIYTVILFLSLFLNYNYEKDIAKKKILIEIYLWMAGIIPIIFIVYGSEIFERIYIYSVVPLSTLFVLAFKDLKSSKKIFNFIIIIFIIFNIPAHYGNESFGTGTLTELAGAKFYSLRMTPQDPSSNNYLYQFDKYIWYYNNDLVKFRHTTLFNLNQSTKELFNSTYIFDTRQTNNMLVFRFGSNFVENAIGENIINLNSLYDNEYFKIFKNVAD